MKRQFRPHYLDHRTGWTPANLGLFPTEAEAQEALKHWLEGYAETHGGYRPPVSVRDEKPAPVCPSCGVNPAEEAHPCPYKEDIDGDGDTVCRCCPDCQHECAQDI